MIKTAILTPTATYTIQSSDSLVDLWLVPSFPVSLLLDLDLSTTTWYNSTLLVIWYKHSQLSDLIYRWKHEKMNIRVKHTLVNVTFVDSGYSVPWDDGISVEFLHSRLSFIVYSRQQSHLRFFHRIQQNYCCSKHKWSHAGAGIRSSTKSNSLFWVILDVIKCYFCSFIRKYKIRRDMP